MKKMIISILGQDRPGIIAAVTKVLLEEDFNIEDVSQTILQNHFSGIFIAGGPDNASCEGLQAAMNRSASGFDLHFHVQELVEVATPWTECDCEPFVITTQGPDRKGLVAQITAVLGAHNVNVSRLQAFFRGGSEPGKNLMIYEVDIPADTDQKKLRQALRVKAEKLSLKVSIQHKKIFEAINRI